MRANRWHGKTATAGGNRTRPKVLHSNDVNLRVTAAAIFGSGLHPAEVANEGFDGLMAGKDHVVAWPLKNKVQAAARHVLPDTVLAGMRRKEPGSAEE